MSTELTPRQARVLAYLRGVAPQALWKCDLKRALHLDRDLQPDLVRLRNAGLVEFHPAGPGAKARWSAKEPA